jgi:hypothetical protein
MEGCEVLDVDGWCVWGGGGGIAASMSFSCTICAARNYFCVTVCTSPPARTRVCTHARTSLRVSAT